MIQKDEAVMLEDDPRRKPREIEFTLKQTFSNRADFHDALMEVAIAKIF